MLIAKLGLPIEFSQNRLNKYRLCKKNQNSLLPSLLGNVFLQQVMHRIIDYMVRAEIGSITEKFLNEFFFLKNFYHSFFTDKISI